MPRKIVDGRQINMKLEEWVLKGLDLLAQIDNRSGRDYMRVVLKRHVEEELEKGTITLDGAERDDDEEKVGGSD